MQQLGLVGRSLGHSFSRDYFARKFEREGLIDFRYDNFEFASPGDLKGVFSIPRLLGFNVTIPYKRDIVPLLDGLSPDARDIGAVNTVVRTPSGWRGHNTDWLGFQLSLKRAGYRPRERSAAIVLGTGGAAAAVSYALKRLGVQVHAVSRTPSAKQLSYAQASDYPASAFDLVVNTTPLGTSPDTDAMPPFDVDVLGGRHLAVDLIYNPPETKFLRRARAAGAQTLNGLPMLRLQAEAAWDIWKNALPSPT